LVTAKANINATDKEGSTALMKAARYGQIECLHLLLAKGADCNLKCGPLDYLPIHWAASNGNYSCLEVLVTVNDIHSADKFGNRPIHLAAANGHSPCVRYLLEKGASTECINNYKETPLHLATFNGHYHCLLLLTLECSDPPRMINMMDDKGMTALHRAVEGGNVQCVSKLLEYKQVDVNARDALGNTCLHLGKESVVHFITNL
jgi:ankyrin repeat protein